ncbi:WecB/TagA/CpsF family glycosyltransferase [Pediococcus argentinicus]|nr:WecB/TagA/CpsF family glycosyltransferase [Pediococcus argentinicus]NKZ23114.1 WecB/TagA/CpsF family glycosyltransferase [Pediococcus argentinicus]GEP20249.1 acetylglucosaminyldiphosphoundecaprenol acetyl-beta-D-mannosaminyltransferase [Pediococcus argentinicus]
MTFKHANILGYSFINTTFDKFMDQIKNDSTQHQNRFIITANPEIVMYARKHPDYQKLVQTADYLTPDGIGIVKASQTLGDPIPDRITGFDIFNNLLEWGNDNQKSVYLLGSKPEVIQKTVQKIQTDYPDLKIAGFHDGYFKDDAPIITEIENTKPDFVFVATGFPKQEEFITTNRHISDSIWMGVGGSFDVYSGTVKRAPTFWQEHHLEWFYRLITDPKRLKRQLVIPQFMWVVWRSKK